MGSTDSIWTVIITLITILGSTSAWKYYEKRAEVKRDDDNFVKQDCRERIAKLEVLLKESSEEKDKMRDNIILLTSQLSKLEVEVDFLRKDNEKLRAENSALRSRR